MPRWTLKEQAKSVYAAACGGCKQAEADLRAFVHRKRQRRLLLERRRRGVRLGGKTMMLGVVIAGCVSPSVVTPPTNPPAVPQPLPPMPGVSQAYTKETTISRSVIIPPAEIVLPAFKVNNTNRLTMWMLLSSTDAKKWKFETWVDGATSVKTSSPQCFYRLEGVPLNSINYNWKPL